MLHARKHQNGVLMIGPFDFERIREPVLQTDLGNRNLTWPLFLLDPRPRDLLAFTRIMSREACQRVPPKTRIAAAYANETDLT